jgi:hypothetical protein
LEFWDLKIVWNLVLGIWDFLTGFASKTKQGTYRIVFLKG